MRKLISVIMLFTLVFLTACTGGKKDNSQITSGGDISASDVSNPDTSGSDKDKMIMSKDIAVSGQNYHMQGFDVDVEKKIMYWSFTDSIVKTDLEGNLLGTIRVDDGHLGDLTYYNGKIYGTLLGSPKEGDKWNAWTGYFAVVYDEYLTRLEKIDISYVSDRATGKVDNPNGIDGIDGIAAGKDGDGNDCIFIAGSVKTGEQYTNQVIMQFDYSFKFQKEYLLNTGNTPFGIQNLKYDKSNKCLWFSTYGPQYDYQTKKTLFKTTQDLLSITESSEYYSPYGFACIENGYYLTSGDNDVDGKKVGYAYIAKYSDGKLSRLHSGNPDGKENNNSEPDPSDTTPDKLTSIKDITGNGYDLSVEGVSLAEDRKGNKNSALTVAPGSKVKVDFATAGKAIEKSGQASVSIWVNPASLEGNYIYVGGLQYTDGNYALVLEYCWGQAVLRLYQNGKEFSDTAYCSAPSKDTWTHYLLTLDGTTAVIYVNGVKEGSITVSKDKVLKDIKYLSIASTAVTPALEPDRVTLSGLVDDVKVFDKALTEADAKALYEDKDIKSAPLAAYDFNGDGGGTVIRNSPDVNGFTFWTENWRKNIFKYDREPDNSMKEISLETAKNDIEPVQICCRSSVTGRIEGVEFTDLKNGSSVIPASAIDAKIIGYYKINTNTFELNNPTAKAPGLFPEKLLNTDACEIKMFETQPIWVRFKIPESIESGNYKGSIKLKTTFGEFNVPVSVTVYNVTLPKTNESAFSLEMWGQLVKCFEDVSGDLDVIGKAYGIKPYSDEWWKLMEKYAEFMKENRMNVLFLNVVDLLKDAPGTKVANDGTVTYDWSLLDRFVELFIEKGGIKSISAEHLCAQEISDGNVKGYKIEIISSESGKNVRKFLPFDDGLSYLDRYLKELNKHLEEKNWKSIWLQHIGDEPTGDNMPQNYVFVSERVHSLCKGVRTGDAFYGENFGDFKDSMDVWVPITTLYEEYKTQFDAKRKSGDLIWFYTAGYPGGDNLNRFIDTQIYKTELLSWYCYKYGATGYLHWGLMEWYVWEDFNVNDTTVGGHNTKYNGDSWCIYPDKENMDITSSIRVEALREAAEDYELLALLAKKDPAAAKKLADKMVTNSLKYENDITAINGLRSSLLKKLAK